MACSQRQGVLELSRVVPQEFNFCHFLVTTSASPTPLQSEGFCRTLFFEESGVLKADFSLLEVAEIYCKQSRAAIELWAVAV